MEKEEIQKIASKCLSCKTKPCRKGCPLTNDITEFIKCIKEQKYREAYDILLDTTILQPICGRICPHKKQCQGACIRGIKGEAVDIGTLEAFIGDMAIENNWPIRKIDAEHKNKKIAIVGGGPAGITAGAYLARRGFSVRIFEKHKNIGGLLVHGIPDFRLPRRVIKETMQKVMDLGIEISTKQELGVNLKLEDLEKEYDAVLLCFGANISSKMNIEGEDLSRCLWWK